MPISKLKVLYYSTAYGASHGGSTHARAFVDNCRMATSMVSEVRVFPDVLPSNRPAKTSSSRFRSLVKNQILLPFLFLRRNRFHLTAIKNTIEEYQPHVVHIRLDSNFLQIKKIREAFPKVLITTEVNASPFDESFKRIPFEQYYRQLERRHLASADLNFFVSNSLKTGIMRNLAHDGRDFVVQNGVDTKIFCRKTPRPQRKAVSTIIYVGTLDQHKRVDMLIKGFSIVRRLFPELKLVIVGEGPDQQMLKDLTRESGQDKSIVFFGRVEHSEIPKLLEGADIAIHPYANDYMSPLKIFEYMAMELPVIGPSTSAVREVFSDEKNIILTSGSVEDIAQKIERLVVDEELRNRISESGHNLVATRFTWDANVTFILTKMLETLNRKAH